MMFEGLNLEASAGDALIIGHCIIKIVCKDLLMVDVDDSNNGARFNNGSFCSGSTVGVVHT
jgi:hypothetical protein